MNIDTAFLLAAGFGTRLRPLTYDTPKPLLKVGNVAIIDRIIEQLRQVGIKKFYVNTHYLQDKFVAHFSGSKDIVLVHEPEILDSAGGVMNLFAHSKVDIALVVNTDEFLETPEPFAKLLSAYDSTRMDMLLLLGKSRDDQELDFTLLDNGKIRRLNRGNNHRYYGISVIASRVFDGRSIAPLSLRDFWFKTEHEELPYYGLVSSHEVLDIGTLEVYNSLQKRFENENKNA